MCNVSDITLSKCHVDKKNGIGFWTAGQRKDPSRESKFVWRLTSSKGSGEKVSVMSYTNWSPGEPNVGGKDTEACVSIWAGQSYKWNDGDCSRDATCAVCELEI